ncbi:hypothetical protein F7725_029129 [Dissostichus mawsoni]|uniref:Phosphoinositide phospholipase C n=1 Tax=Dissostichus mawsoni TaxID=36200 RepID=A0A7J5XI23_DISMA|nr:hypothetical protein F7725_029129 [Dissostichus mawsoni]
MSCLPKRLKKTKSEEEAFLEKARKIAHENGKRLGLEGDADLNFLLVGGELIKIRSSSWKRNRFFKLQEDCKTLCYINAFLSPVSIDDIESVRKGRQSEGLNKHTDPSGRKKNLDLMAANGTEAKQWISGLDKIIHNMRNLSRQQKSEHWIINCMRKADKNEDNKMTLKELKHFLRQVNVEVDDTYAAEIFKKCDTSNSGSLEGEEIEHFYDLLTHREEVDVIYGNYAQTEGQMSSKDLLNFLLTEQREKVSMEDALKLIEKYEVDGTAKQNKRMSKDGFLMYLHREEGSIFNPAHKQVYQDMHQPINHYISSSHNTYLMEDQLKGPSSTEAYIKALMKSCRCVELDCWDGANGEPVIYHGYTLTSKVLFRDNHCSVDQQKLMAHHLISILGEALLTKPVGNTMPSDFPSPEGLKGKFLIKGKRLNKLDAALNINNSTIEEDTKSKIKLAKALSDIVVYCKSVHFRIRTRQGLPGTAYIHHNMDKLSRIYPAGSRTDSSNYNPVPMWNVGCQIVALNFQTPSKEMHINQGRFLQNGFNPMWNEKFQFDIHVAELALLRFVVEDYDSTSQNDLIGQYCLPLSSVQNGYRHVPLLTKRGDVICSAGLFVHLMLVDAQ